VIWVTRAYLLGLIGHSLLEVAARSFYAKQDATTPLFVAALNAAAYIVIAIALSGWIGPVGIALANTIAFTAEALVLLYLLNRQQPGILNVKSTLVRVSLASIVGGIIVYFILQFAPGSLLFAMLGLGIGGLFVLPFVFPEIKILIKLT
jgi:putative peptidoglycan lipid II flippase